MNRVTSIFLGLLALATFASGQVWMQSRILASGPVTILNIAVITGSGLLLLASLIALGRMLTYTAKAPVAVPTMEDENA